MVMAVAVAVVVGNGDDGDGDGDVLVTVDDGVEKRGWGFWQTVFASYWDVALVACTCIVGRAGRRRSPLRG